MKITVLCSVMGDELQSLIAHPVAPATIDEVPQYCKKELASGLKGLKRSLAERINRHLQQHALHFLDYPENARIRLINEHLGARDVQVQTAEVETTTRHILARVKTLNGADQFLKGDLCDQLPPLPAEDTLPDAALARRRGSHPRAVRLFIVALDQEAHVLVRRSFSLAARLRPGAPPSRLSDYVAIASNEADEGASVWSRLPEGTELDFEVRLSTVYVASKGESRDYGSSLGLTQSTGGKKAISSEEQTEPALFSQ